MKTDKFTLFVYCNFLVLQSTTVCSQNINKQNVMKLLQITAFSVGITLLNQRIILKNDIEFVTDYWVRLGYSYICLIQFGACECSQYFIDFQM